MFARRLDRRGERERVPPVQRTQRLDREQAELFSMRFLLGCTSDETAELTGLSKATVDRRVRLARGWLFQRLRGESSPADSANE